jgi:hypothetical protein
MARLAMSHSRQSHGLATSLIALGYGKPIARQYIHTRLYGNFERSSSMASQGRKLPWLNKSIIQKEARQGFHRTGLKFH